MKPYFLGGLLCLSSILGIAAEKKADFKIMPGGDWTEFTHHIDVAPGSALDMSFLNDPPAGKFGRIVIRDGQFQFENIPGRQARFHGVNFNFSANFPDHKQAEELAVRLAACGYNALRIHHYDRDLVNYDAGGSLTFDPQQLDKLNYLFHCMKQRGIYITTDIFVSRDLAPEDADADILTEKSRRIKVAAVFSRKIQDNLKEFARKLLTQVNPYTGMTWKDDPAFISLSFINENNLGHIWNKNTWDEALFQQKFAAWKQAHPQWTKVPEKEAFNRFIVESQLHNYEVFRDYVGGELKCKMPFTDCNFVSNIIISLVRKHFDYIDNHCYFDHPKRKADGTHHENFCVLDLYCKVPTETMPSRIFGKPFTLSEYNYVFPNSFRCEGSVVMGSLAALQGWDGIYRFAFARCLENATQLSPASRYDVITDPINLLGERIIALLFRRGDVTAASECAPFIVTPDCVKLFDRMLRCPSSYYRLGLIFKLGTVVADGAMPRLPDGSRFAVTLEQLPFADKLPVKLFQANTKLADDLYDSGLLPKKYFDPETGAIMSSTNEISTNVKTRTYTVITPRSECFVLPGGASATGKFMRASVSGSYSTLFVSSLDGKGLSESGRLLLLHLTDIKNTGTSFKTAKQRILLSDGELPHLVRKGSATIRLSHPAAAGIKVWALGMNGQRIGAIPTQIGNTGKEVEFAVATDGLPGGCLAYEITVE